MSATAPILKLDRMFAHCGNCETCKMKGTVKMPRDLVGKLRPECCCCINCGQLYFMEIADLDLWERKQWEQKQAMDRRA